MVPKMWSRPAMDPDLIYMCRQEDVSFTVFCCFTRNNGSRNLEAGIQARRMNLIGTKFSFRLLSNERFTQHSSVMPPQTSKALKKRAVVDTAFTQSRIIVLSRGLIRASSLDLLDRLRPRRRDSGVRSRTNFSAGM